jgi:hypothetical protein
VRFNREVKTTSTQRFNDLIAAPSLNSVRKAADILRRSLINFTSGIKLFDAWIADRRTTFTRGDRDLAVPDRADPRGPVGGDRHGDTYARARSCAGGRTARSCACSEQGRADAAMRRYHECAEVLRREHGRELGPKPAAAPRDRARAAKTPAPRGRASKDGPVLILLVEDDRNPAALIEDSWPSRIRGGDGEGRRCAAELGRRGFDLLILTSTSRR